MLAQTVAKFIKGSICIFLEIKNDIIFYLGFILLRYIYIDRFQVFQLWE